MRSAARSGPSEPRGKRRVASSNRASVRAALPDLSAPSASRKKAASSSNDGGGAADATALGAALGADAVGGGATSADVFEGDGTSGVSTVSAVGSGLCPSGKDGRFNPDADDEPRGDASDSDIGNALATVSGATDATRLLADADDASAAADSAATGALASPVEAPVASA